VFSVRVCVCTWVCVCIYAGYVNSLSCGTLYGRLRAKEFLHRVLHAMIMGARALCAYIHAYYAHVFCLLPFFWSTSGSIDVSLPFTRSFSPQNYHPRQNFNIVARTRRNAKIWSRISDDIRKRGIQGFSHSCERMPTLYVSEEEVRLLQDSPTSEKRCARLNNYSAKVSAFVLSFITASIRKLIAANMHVLRVIFCARAPAR
jgi:hypothetical protein